MQNSNKLIPFFSDAAPLWRPVSTLLSVLILLSFRFDVIRD